ncbi:MAG: hypothetical protein KatS3mg102_2790 [Planctomycetota bacterium]|nr:MAG: hypothetical protein KatS3mg102_2790 [Planctomycetota bacterium]
MDHRLELTAGLLLLLAAGGVLWHGAASWRRAAARERALAAYHSPAAPADAAAAAAARGLASFPDDPVLLAVRAAALARRAADRERAEAAYGQLLEATGAPQARALAAAARAALALAAARESTDEAERSRALERAERALAAAGTAAGAAPTAVRAVQGALALARGEVQQALAILGERPLAAAGNGTAEGAPPLGALLGWYSARAAALAAAGDPAGAAAALRPALLLAPGRAELGERHARLVASGLARAATGGGPAPDPEAHARALAPVQALLQPVYPLMRRGELVPIYLRRPAERALVEEALGLVRLQAGELEAAVRQLQSALGHAEAAARLAGRAPEDDLQVLALARAIGIAYARWAAAAADAGEERERRRLAAIGARKLAETGMRLRARAEAGEPAAAGPAAARAAGSPERAEAAALLLEAAVLFQWSGFMPEALRALEQAERAGLPAGASARAARVRAAALDGLGRAAPRERIAAYERAIEAEPEHPLVGPMRERIAELERRGSAVICPHCEADTPASAPRCVRCGGSLDVTFEELSGAVLVEEEQRQQWRAEVRARGVLTLGAVLFALALLAHLLLVPRAPEVVVLPVEPMLFEPPSEPAPPPAPALPGLEPVIPAGR